MVMKRKALWIIALMFFLHCSLCLPVSCAEGKSKNMVRNSGFEKKIDYKTQGWFCFNRKKNKYDYISRGKLKFAQNIYLDGNIKHSGKFSLRIEPPVMGIEFSNNLGTSLKPDHSYRFSFYYRTEKGAKKNTFRGKLQTRGKIKQPRDFYFKNLAMTNGKWKAFTFDFIAPKNISSLSIRLFFDGGKFWIDDISLTPILTETGRLKPAGQSVLAEDGKTFKELGLVLPPEIFYASVSKYSQKKRVNYAKYVNKIFRAMPFNISRIWSGSTGPYRVWDGYREEKPWVDCKYQSFCRLNPKPHFKLDHAINWLYSYEKTKGKACSMMLNTPMMRNYPHKCKNLPEGGWLSPAEAVTMYRYCISRSVDIPYICIGNEADHWGLNKTLRPGYFKDEFIKKYASFYDALKQEAEKSLRAGKIKSMPRIGVNILNPAQIAPHISKNKSSLEVFLDYANNKLKFDWLSFHYYANLKRGNPQQLLDKVNFTLIIKNIRIILDKYNLKNVEILSTETGISPSHHAIDVFPQYSNPSYIFALWRALVIFQCMNSVQEKFTALFKHSPDIPYHHFVPEKNVVIPKSAKKVKLVRIISPTRRTEKVIYAMYNYETEIFRLFNDAAGSDVLESKSIDSDIKILALKKANNITLYVINKNLSRDVNNQIIRFEDVTIKDKKAKIVRLDTCSLPNKLSIGTASIEKDNMLRMNIPRASFSRIKFKVSSKQGRFDSTKAHVVQCSKVKGVVPKLFFGTNSLYFVAALRDLTANPGKSDTGDPEFIKKQLRLLRADPRMKSPRGHACYEDTADPIKAKTNFVK
jgi:Carbohydrate binding domain